MNCARVILVFLFSALIASAADSPRHGLYVESGALMKDGKPYHGIGVNYFDLFSRTLAKPDDSSSLTNLAVLARANIPFVRFMCGGYWPSEQRAYFTNRDAWFAQLDRVVRCAETNHIGLIPSLFWFFATAPDLAGEHIDQLGNPNSKTIQWIRDYTADVVKRYRDSPAIWGWEFGNEYTLDCDLPNASSHRAAIVPVLGTPSARDERDELKFAQLEIALKTFAGTVRKFDPTRAVFSGNAAPRSSAWHNVRENSWKPDSPAQFEEILLRDNPDPIDSVTIHVYPETSGNYPANTKSIDEFLATAQSIATKSRKPLFLGEFGAPRQIGPPEKQREILESLLNSIRKNQIPLAAFWVFDFPAQENDFSVDFKNDRSYVLELIERANAASSSR